MNHTYALDRRGVVMAALALTLVRVARTGDVACHDRA
jgi:hypothetical protein